MSEEKEKSEFDKLFNELFNSDKDKKNTENDDDEEEIFKKILEDDGNDDDEEEGAASKTEDDTSKTTEDDFKWLQDLIDDIDKDAVQKKELIAPTEVIKGKFLSKIQDRPRAPAPPKHVAEYGSGKKIVKMPQKEALVYKKRSYRKVIKYIILCILSIVIIITIGGGSYWLYDKYFNLKSYDSSIIMTQLYSGDKILIDVRNISKNGREIVSKGYIDGQISNLMYQLVQPGDKVIDVGAGFGYHTLYLSRLVGNNGTVYAFEARKSIFELLDASVQINHFTNIKLFNNVLFSSKERIKLNTNDNQKRSNFGTMSIILEQGQPYVNDSVEQINAYPLDAILTDVSNISLLHINTHGSELNVILGAMRLISHSPKIKIITSWSKHQMSQYINVQQIVQQLLDNGFRFWLIKPSNGSLVELTRLEHVMQVERGRLLISKSLH